MGDSHPQYNLGSISPMKCSLVDSFAFFWVVIIPKKLGKSQQISMGDNNPPR